MKTPKTTTVEQEQAHAATLLQKHVSWINRPEHKKLVIVDETREDAIEFDPCCEAHKETVAALGVLLDARNTKRTRKWSYRFVNWFNSFGKL